VEVDGGQNDEREPLDRARTACISSKGIRVLRFWNNEVLENVEGVLSRILEALVQAHRPLPQAGGA
jgi:very-short-patch-repair endonuclease